MASTAICIGLGDDAVKAGVHEAFLREYAQTNGLSICVTTTDQLPCAS